MYQRRIAQKYISLNARQIVKFAGKARWEERGFGEWAMNLFPPDATNVLIIS
jgi:hypothetical protein